MLCTNVLLRFQKGVNAELSCHVPYENLQGR